jgi:hypothetical protein
VWVLLTFVLLVLPTGAGAAPPKGSASPNDSAPAAPAAAGRATFGVAPSSVTGPDGRSVLAYAVSPGEVLYDHVAALNYSSEPLTVQLYVSDAVESAQGQFGLALASARRAGVGSWISVPLQDSTITIPARSALSPGVVVVPITVSVPSSAAPGDHAGGILVSLSTTGRNRNGEEITLDQRTGTRVLVTVAGAAAPRLTVTDVHASYSGTANPIGRGAVHLSYSVRNTGNVDLSVALGASVSGLLGARVQSHLPGVSFLLPGASVSETALIRGVWPQIVSRTSVTASARTIDTGKSAALAPVSATATVWTVPWVLLIILVVLVAAALLYVRRRKNRPRPNPTSGAGSSPASSPDAKVKVSA